MKIVVTGGAGFIGSCLVGSLNQKGYNNIIIVDELGKTEKWKNLVSKQYDDYFDKAVFRKELLSGSLDKHVDAIVHLGACSATTEQDASYLMDNNYKYTKDLAKWCLNNGKRFLYASSAATYGDGESSYSDQDSVTPTLKPLNMYGYSKQAFDLWVLKNKLQDKVVGFKFFNVYGPNEYHKDDMRSMVHKGYQQIKKEKKIRLFKSYKSDFGDGEQKRDFIYVKDAVSVVEFFLENHNLHGIINVGTGLAHSWNDLANAIFDALRIPKNIEYIEMPDKLKGKYQYFTEADTSKITDLGYSQGFRPLNAAVKDYVDILETTQYI